MKTFSSISSALLLLLSVRSPVYAELLFDRGLPSELLNNVSGQERSNIRWTAGFDNQTFYGDDFVIGQAGQHYVIDHIRTWTVAGHRNDWLATPEELGDWFSTVSLLGGLPSDPYLPVLATGDLAVDSSEINAPNIVIRQVTYPDEGGSLYDNFGRILPIWQIDFYNLNWVVEGGTRYNFSVQGIGRQLEDSERFHGWYNHASSARFETVPQQGADNLMLIFSNNGEFVRVAEAEEHWDSPSDINIQIFGRPIETGAVTALDRPTSQAARSLPDIVQALHKAELLTGRTYRRSLIEVEQGVFDQRSRLLYRIAYGMYEDSLSERSVPHGAMLFTGFAELPNEEELAAMQALLDQLNATGILSERVYQQLQMDIPEVPVRLPFSLYQRATDLMGLYEALEPHRVAPHLDELHEVGLMSDRDRDNLLNALETESLRDPIEFLKYIDQAIFFDLRNYSDVPEEYFPEIHQSIANMLIETNIVSDIFSEFEVTLRPNQESSRFLYYDAINSVQAADRYYRYPSFYSPPTSEFDFLGKLDSTEFVHLFNKILRDKGSSHRLYTVKSTSHSFRPSFGKSAPQYAQFGIIALTEEQADVYLEYSYKPHDPLPELTSDRIDEILTLFEQIGLLDHLSEAQIVAGHDRIEESYITQSYRLFDAFDRVFLDFVWDVGTALNPYQAVVGGFADISQGYFTPTEVTGEFDEVLQANILSFTLNGTDYTAPVELWGDWLEPQVLELMQSAADQEVPHGQFHTVYDDSFLVGSVFLTDAQLQTLKAENIFQFEPVD
ncbi:MAG: hypothetical protein AAFX78_00485 [Cyanobacteria bacterium J06638_20]